MSYVISPYNNAIQHPVLPSPCPTCRDRQVKAAGRIGGTALQHLRWCHLHGVCSSSVELQLTDKGFCSIWRS